MKPLWGTDPVHPVTDAYTELAKVILTEAETRAGGSSGAKPVPGRGAHPNRVKRKRSPATDKRETRITTSKLGVIAHRPSGCTLGADGPAGRGNGWNPVPGLPADGTGSGKDRDPEQGNRKRYSRP